MIVSLKEAQHAFIDGKKVRRHITKEEWKQEQKKRKAQLVKTFKSGSWDFLGDKNEQFKHLKYKLIRDVHSKQNSWENNYVYFQNGETFSKIEQIHHKVPKKFLVEIKENRIGLDKSQIDDVYRIPENYSTVNSPLISKNTEGKWEITPD